MRGFIGTRIIGVGAAVPTSIVTNADLESLVETSDEWISTRTGIKQRRIVKNQETCTSLAIAAAKDAIEFSGIEAEAVDLIIVATSTPDHLYPSTACLVQAAVGATRAAAFDLEAACTGIIYAMSVAQQFIATGTFKTVVVVGVDIHSRFLNWEDRNTCVLFGDGAGAFVLQASETENDILACYLGADGSGGNLLRIPNTGTNYPHEGNISSETTHGFLQMNGKAIYEFAIKAVPEAVKEACRRADILVEDLDYFIPHQANKRIIKAAAEKLNLPPSKIVSNIDEYGNTSAASIPLAFSDALKSGQIQAPSTCALVGFGGGLTWGAIIARWRVPNRN